MCSHVGFSLDIPVRFRFYIRCACLTGINLFLKFSGPNFGLTGAVSRFVVTVVENDTQLKEEHVIQMTFSDLS